MLLSALLHWIISAIILLLVSAILPGFTIDGIGTALIASLILGVVNLLIRPILLLLTLPLSIVTLGLFAFVINALMLMLVAWLVPGFIISNFLSALVGAVLLSLMTSLLSGLTSTRLA